MDDISHEWIAETSTMFLEAVELSDYKQLPTVILRFGMLCGALMRSQSEVRRLEIQVLEFSKQKERP